MYHKRHEAQCGIITCHVVRARLHLTPFGGLDRMSMMQMGDQSPRHSQELPWARVSSPTSLCAQWVAIFYAAVPRSPECIKMWAWSNDCRLVEASVALRDRHDLRLSMRCDQLYRKYPYPPKVSRARLRQAGSVSDGMLIPRPFSRLCDR